MKTVRIEWLDADNMLFRLSTAGLWPQEIEQLTVAFTAVGYRSHALTDFSARDPRDAKLGPSLVNSVGRTLGLQIEQERPE